jgi:hypothetical protein
VNLCDNFSRRSQDENEHADYNDQIVYCARFPATSRFHRCGKFDHLRPVSLREQLKIRLWFDSPSICLPSFERVRETRGGA